ncbi:MAG: hypothetical protein AAF725_18555, partial [Acidobacteriota bacterium]
MKVNARMLSCLALSCVSLALFAVGESEAEEVSSVASQHVLKDSSGRVSLVESDTDTVHFSYRATGELSFKDSQRFGRTDFVYSPEKASGPFARLRILRQASPVGVWERQFIHDANGEVALQLEGMTPAEARQIVESLEPFFWPAGLQSYDAGTLRAVDGRDFASIQIQRNRAGVKVQESSVLGRSLVIRTDESQAGLLRISDDEAGERFETWVGNTL